MTDVMLLITVGSIHLGGLISPGPDFALVLRNSLSRDNLILSRKLAGITALGLASGVLIHTLLSILGISMLIKSQPMLFTGLQLVGAVYLLYLGYGALKSGWARVKSGCITSLGIDDKKQQNDGIWQVYLAGLMTNLLNPKALVYFISLISAFVVNSSSISLKLGIAAELFLLTFIWFSLLAVFLSTKKMQEWINQFEGYINIATGMLFSGVGTIIVWQAIHNHDWIF
ncbi:LysE family transporter [Endozoicomonas sp. SM1973]|uniref:LysE family transporter n=1 Tax=Spartinivicinus marinus TaxID=2994442 RepID=A0A853I9E7_9GAMM|nr:LysE family transporter [Spartinivicinus marinus]MCX4026823.1 LysE family transporter [Spartinivicinus marinus]NYZ69509.1 LysE family transporter [Spartinivicinus marinus]